MGFLSKLKKDAVPKPKCLQCGMFKNGCHSPRIEVSGKGEKNILIINSTPSDADDRFCTHISDDNGGRTLINALNYVGIDIYNDCYRTNVINCLPLSDKGLVRKPTDKELKLCKPSYEAVIKRLKPEKIILLGIKESISSFYKERQSNMSATKCRGMRFLDSKFNCFVYPIQHPKIVEYKDTALDHMVFQQDIINAIEDKTEYIPYAINESKIHILTNAQDTVTALRLILSTAHLIAFDYETTGLKPYLLGHKLLSCSVTMENMETYSFMLQHKLLQKSEQQKIMRLWRKILTKKSIYKIIAGYQFEYSWSKVLCNITPQSFYWDTQLCTHLIDNRPDITRLKFQIFQKYGIADYDKESKQFIKSKDGSPFNTMELMPIKSMLRYNGIDSYGTMELFKQQYKEISELEIRKPYNFFMRSIHSLTKMHLNGIAVDINYYKKQQTKITAQLDVMLQDMIVSDDGKLFSQVMGRSLNPASPDDLKKLFFDIKNLPSPKKTKKGADSVDEEALGKIDSPLCGMILSHRKLFKLKGTYIDGILKETHEGILRPNFSLNNVISYRGASQSPNFQNLPKRNKVSKKLIRTGLIPRRLRCLSEGDYSGAEVLTSLAYHKDPTFYNFLANPDADMHRHVSSKAFLLKEPQVTKTIRRDCKALTFGWFYGDYFGSLAETAWEFAPEHTLDDGTPLMEHLHNQNIHTLDNFKNHLKDVEYYFWHEMFPVYTQWKKDIVAFYHKHGYIETFFGFKFTAPMDDKQVTNYPIQSTSFHLLLYVINKLQRILEKRKMETKIIGQIHDACVADVIADEMIEYHNIIYQLVSNLQGELPWLPLPMEIEFELSDTRENGGNFANMETFTIEQIRAGYTFEQVQTLNN